MAAVSCKRPREEMDIVISPQCSPLVASYGLPLKRIRTESSPHSPHRPSFFPKSDIGKVEQNLPVLMKQSKISDDFTEKLYTHEEVKEIVAKALQQKENELRQEYDEILLFRLQEQFQSFTRFNEDCISRQARDGDFSYIV